MKHFKNTLLNRQGVFESFYFSLSFRPKSGNPDAVEESLEFIKILI